MRRLTAEDYAVDAVTAAKMLVGAWLCRRLEDGSVVRRRITETEAYCGEEDTACHAHKGRTARTDVMYSPGGCAYVYLCYGMHEMLNVVTGSEGWPEAVLIRGVEGAEGPGRLTKLLKIDRSLNREDLVASDRLWIESDGSRVKFTAAPRIGIAYASLRDQKRKWRFTLQSEAHQVKRGLVLEGGGMRGLFTAGVLDVLMERGVRFDGLVGVSAGACFGCNYKSGQVGRVIRYNKRFARDPRYCSWSSLLRTGDLFNAGFCYHDLPAELDVFDAESYAANPMEFHVVATDCATGKAVYRRLDIADETAFKWIQASASMPLVARPVEIDGSEYLDGGLSDGIPLRYFESLGYNRNVVVTTRPHGYRKYPSWKHRLAKPFLRRYPAIYKALKTRHEWYNDTLKYIDLRVAAGAAFLVAPDGPLDISRICHDPKRMQAVYDVGRRKADAVLDGIKGLLS